MNTTIPNGDEVVAMLAPMTTAQLHELAALSDVPFHTLLKIRSGITDNPRIDTVHKFLPHLKRVTQPAVA